MNESVKRRIEPLKASFSYFKSAHSGNKTSESNSFPPVVHNVITTHPITGEKSINVNPADTTRILGVSEEESRFLLDILFKQVADSHFIYQHEWQEKDLVIWDNRLTQHRGTHCESKYPRMLLRTTVAGVARNEKANFIDSSEKDYFQSYQFNFLNPLSI